MNRNATKPPLGADNLLPGTAATKSLAMKAVIREESTVHTRQAMIPQRTTLAQLIFPIAPPPRLLNLPMRT